MPTKGGTTMTTRARTLVPDQNPNFRHKEGAAKAQTDGSEKAQQKPGVGIRKALANITNSEKPSEKPYFHPKQNQLNKCANKEVPIAIEQEQCQAKTSSKHLLNTILPLDDERVGIRKPLANITNTEKLSFQKEPKKTQLKKCAKEEAPIAIEEERCAHNHQCCISLQAKTSTQHLLDTILSLDDEKSPVELWSPKTPSTILIESKVDFASTPRYLDFTQTPFL